MNGVLCEEAEEVSRILHSEVETAGGVDLARRAAVEHASRSAAEEIFEAVGIWDLRPLTDVLELEVAAASCRVAGRFALPYPVVERIGRVGSAGSTALLASTGVRVVDHADLQLDWTGIDLYGRVSQIELVDVAAGIGSTVAPFAFKTEATPTGEVNPRAAACLTTLQSWWLLGLLEQALADSIKYAKEREQFGRPLIKFQGVGFQLADMSVETQALNELAKYTLWSLAEDSVGETALTDAIGLRVAALRAAQVVMRGAHQVHGAMGFTDEVDVSWFSRASQTARRLPEGQHRTSLILSERIEKSGWGIFGQLTPSA